MDEITETDKAYLAGLIDGEGCITIARASHARTPTPIYHLIVAVSSCDKDILEYWANKTGYGSVKVNRKEDGEWRANYHWWITSRNAASLLHDVYKYLMIKREQADIAFSFINTLAPVGGWGQKGGTRGGKKTPQEIIHQRERYKQALTRMKGYKSTRGRPPGIST